MEALKAPVIAAFIAALVGSFFGAYFKERLADWFSHKKRQREIRTALIKNIVKYLGFVKELTSINNACEYHITFARKMNDHLKQITGTEKLESEKQRDDIINLINRLNDRSSEVYSKVLEIEFDIVSISMEASHYFKRHQYLPLNKTVKELRTYANSLDTKV
jgi:hypothetical protein